MILLRWWPRRLSRCQGEVLKKQKAFPKLGDFNDRQKDVEGEEYYKARLSVNGMAHAACP